MRVKISMNKQYWIAGVVCGFNPITERFLIASPQDGRLLAYNFIANLDEEIISESELEQIKKEQREIAIQSLSNLRSKFSV
jgi:hypothetical protein